MRLLVERDLAQVVEEREVEARDVEVERAESAQTFAVESPLEEFLSQVLASVMMDPGRVKGAYQCQGVVEDVKVRRHLALHDGRRKGNTIRQSGDKEIDEAHYQMEVDVVIVLVY